MVVSSRLRDSDRLVAGIEQREAAGAVGRFHHAGRETALPDGRRLLIAGDAADRNRSAERSGGRAEIARAVAHLRQQRAAARGTARQAPGPIAPLWISNSSVRAALVASVACTLPAGQPPEQETCRRCRRRVAPPPPPRARRRRDRAARRSWWRRNTDRAAARSCAAMSGSWPLRRASRADAGGAAILPDDRVVDRLAGRAVPDHRGLALVGDADGGDVLRREAGLRHSVRARSRPRSTRSPPDRARPGRAPDRSARNSCCAVATGRERQHRTRWRGSRSCPDRSREMASCTGSTPPRSCVRRRRHEALRGALCSTWTKRNPSLLRRHSTSSASTRPFLCHQIAHFGRGQIGAEARARDRRSCRACAENIARCACHRPHQPHAHAPSLRNGQVRRAVRDLQRRRRHTENRRPAAARARSTGGSARNTCAERLAAPPRRACR